MKKILIIGATSAIAQSTARLFAQKKSALYLVARNSKKLDIVASDLKTRGAEAVFTRVTDLNNFEEHTLLIQDAAEKLSGIDVLLIAHGVLPDQLQCQSDFKSLRESFETNFLSAASLIELSAASMEKRQSGVIAVISSVAGDRGRQSNYVYGSAKGALSIYLQGLRQRLMKKNISVLTIKPGFVDTPMTSQIAKKGPLFASADQVGMGIYRSILKRRDVVYLPWFWRIIMLVIKSVPEFIFKKASL